MKTIATINFKGGVGKTTVTWCLGDVLSTHLDHTVLLFDLDAQGSLTQSIAVESSGRARDTFQEWESSRNNIDGAIRQFMDGNSFDFDPSDNFIYKLYDNYHFVPSVAELYWLELKSFDPGKEFFIKKLLGYIENSKTLPRYDYALFDCPPSFTFLSYSALTCCDLILIPVNLDFFAAKGVDILLRVLKEKIRPNPLPEIVVVANRVRESHQMIGSIWGMAPTHAEKGWIGDIKNVCAKAREEISINAHYLDVYIRGRVAIRDAMIALKSPSQHRDEFINLWNESGGKLK